MNGGFMLQEPAFALDTTAVACERTIGPDHAVTGHHNSDRIGAIGKSNCPHGVWPADPLGELP